METGTVQYKSASLRSKYGMGLHLQHDVQVACRAAVAAGLAFARNAQARIRIHARRNSQIDCAAALDAALPAAIGANFAHDLSRAAAIRAGARNGEKALLVMNLSAAAARHARHDARSCLRARAVADFAKFQTRNADFRVHAGGGFLKTQFHVVAKIRAALRAAPSAAPSAENILESEEVPENILEFIKDGLIDAAIESAAGEPRIAKAVIGGAFLRVGEDRICFRRFAEFFLRFLLGVRDCGRDAISAPLFDRRISLRPRWQCLGTPRTS